MKSNQLIYINVNYTTSKHWISVAAEHQHGNCYRVLESSEDPEHEYRQFEAGDIVRCGVNEFYESENGLIAVSKCNCEIEVKLSVQRALLGAIPSLIRAVSIAVDNYKIHYRCVFDSKPKES